MRRPILSIITPVYNGAHYLPGFIQSVIDQRCEHVEHILVDGNSQDGSYEIIKDFQKKHSHIHSISEKDNGSGEAINKGLGIAQGKFIGVLCLNDYFEPNTLNVVVQLLPRLPSPVFLVGNCNILNEKDELINVNKPEALTTLGVLLKKEFPYNPSAYFYDKELHQKAGLYQNCDQLDVDFFLRAFDVAKVHYVDRCFGNFRMTADSITVRAIREGKLEEGKEKLFEKYLRTHPVWKRLWIKAICFVDKKSKILYYLQRIKHYFFNPKDMVRLFRKKSRKD